ncbi:MAG TPA: peptidase S10 [Candidatus Krumholzibacteria bacterium]|nr:peptidase S10 [Candidatus Krumholzibacteria bacterium]
MKRSLLLASVIAALLVASLAAAKDKPAGDKTAKEEPKNTNSQYFTPETVTTNGTVTVEGTRVDYRAECGTIVVHPKGWDDAAPKPDKDSKADAEDRNPDAEASMFYVAYFKNGAEATKRPVMFLFNGGPGSATVWLHMGAFGPRRVITADDSHTPAAPYDIVNNDYSLLDVADLVFIDAPGTGFSRIAGKNAEKSFYGVDADAHAFAEFITAFLSRYGRWNSPKYIFGESYGTPRAAVLVNMLQGGYALDINGVVMLSQILNFDLSVDDAESNPGMDLPYVVALPTYAATAWYHHKLPGDAPATLDAFLDEVKAFASGEYATALLKGAQLSDDERKAMAEKLHGYTGLPVAYILKANLRIDGGEFEKNLQDDTDTTTGRLDSRFSGPTLDPLSKEAEYDPQSAAIASAYVSAFNEYARKTLKFGHDRTYKPFAGLWRKWDFHHSQPGQFGGGDLGVCNTMPDLAMAMKFNPGLKVLLTGGYFDIATPFYEGWYEMQHLKIPAKLQSNITYHYYQSGHMVYAHQESLKAIHDDVAAFVRSTNNIKK